MKNRAAFPLALAILVLLSSTPCRASDKPWRLTAGAGGTVGSSGARLGSPGIGTLAVSRSLTRHVGLQLRTTYLWPTDTGIGTQETVLPIGLGLLVGESHSSGLTIEASPSIFVSRWENSYGSFTTALPGYQVGASVQVPVINRAGLNIGMLYMHSKDYRPSEETDLLSQHAGPDSYHEGLDEITAFFGIAVGI